MMKKVRVETAAAVVIDCEDGVVDIAADVDG